MEERKAYLDDVNNEEWAFVARFLTLLTKDAPQWDYSFRAAFNELRCLKHGC